MKKLRSAVACLPALFAIGCAGVLGIPSDVDRAEPETPDGSHDATMSDDTTFVPDGYELEPDADADVDAQPDAGPPLCTVSKDFGAPEPVTSVNTAADEGAARLSEDELTMYIDAPRATNGGSFDIWFAKRNTMNDPFGAYTPFPSGDSTIETADDEYAPNLTADGKTLIFERKTLATGDSNLYIATRTSTALSFGTVSSIANLNTPDYEANVFLRDTTTELWHVRKPIQGGADVDIAVATLDPVSGYVIEPADGQLANVNMLNTYDASPVISQNGLALYFASDRAAPFAGTNIWVATRTVKGGKFNTPVIVANVNSPSNEYPGFISADGCRLYLVSDRPGGQGGQDIYMTKRPL